MDDSYESMDTSISPVQQRSANGSQKFGEKYDEGNNTSHSPNVLQQQQQWNEEESGDIIIVGDGGSEVDQRWDACVGVCYHGRQSVRFGALGRRGRRFVSTRAKPTPRKGTKRALGLVLDECTATAQLFEFPCCDWRCGRSYQLDCWLWRHCGWWFCVRDCWF